VTPLTEARLAVIMPRVDAPKWTAPLVEAMDRFTINRADVAASFLAHVAHESDECRRLSENLRYSAARLHGVWPKRFPTLESAKPYAFNPEKLANFVYANRMGNGPTASGDGWRFRGRGLLHTTGRSNYRAAGQALGLFLEEHPELLEQPLPAALAAAHFFTSGKCDELAQDLPDDDDQEDFRRITRLINGGLNGLAERQVYWERAKAVLS
jgi:putative chitinase